MFQLDKLIKTVSKKKRIGRGGSRGGTSGRGHKGQNARSGGKVRPGFEGGQMPLSRRLPKRGFNNARFQDNNVIVSLKQLNDAFDEGAVVTREELASKGFISRKKISRIKVLAKGALEKKLVIHADAFSKKAEEEIKKVGGEVHVG